MSLSNVALVHSFSDLLADTYPATDRLAASTYGDDFVTRLRVKDTNAIVDYWRNVTIAPGIMEGNAYPVAFVYSSRPHATSTNYAANEVTFDRTVMVEGEERVLKSKVKFVGAPGPLASLGPELAQFINNLRIPVHDETFISILLPATLDNVKISDNSWELAFFCCMMGTSPLIATGSVRQTQQWDVAALRSKAQFAISFGHSIFIQREQMPSNSYGQIDVTPTGFIRFTDDGAPGVATVTNPASLFMLIMVNQRIAARISAIISTNAPKPPTGPQATEKVKTEVGAAELEIMMRAPEKAAPEIKEMLKTLRDAIWDLIKSNPDDLDKNVAAIRRLVESTRSSFGGDQGDSNYAKFMVAQQQVVKSIVDKVKAKGEFFPGNAAGAAAALMTSVGSRLSTVIQAKHAPPQQAPRPKNLSAVVNPSNLMTSPNFDLSALFGRRIRPRE